MKQLIYDCLIDFGLPVFIIGVCAALLFTGRDGEIKSILTLAAGWIFKSGWQRKPQKGAK